MRIILARNYTTRSHCKIYDAVRRLDTLIYVRIPFGLKLFLTSVQLLRHRRLEAPVVVRARPAVATLAQGTAAAAVVEWPVADPSLVLPATAVVAGAATDTISFYIFACADSGHLTGRSRKL